MRTATSSAAWRSSAALTRESSSLRRFWSWRRTSSINGGDEGGALGEGGGGLGGMGGGVLGDGDILAQTSSRLKLQPVPVVQPPSSSSTVQSLAPAASQMASAWAKVWLLLQSTEPPHTEQPAFFFQVLDEGWVSEQHRTCAATGTHGQYALRWGGCVKRTSCSSFSALSPGVSVQDVEKGFPHATGAVS